jgi:tetratricopeptide (TPR) repeat protein
MKRPRDRSVARTGPAALRAATTAPAPWSAGLSAAIFSAALAARLIHVFQIRRAPFFDLLMGDARTYDAWAQRIAGGDWFGSEVFYQAPLYPYFLGALYAIAGRDLLVVRLAQAAIGAAACVLLAQAAARLFSRTAGIVAGLFLALYAPAIFFDGLIQKSVIDVFFVCLVLWLMSGIITAPHASLRVTWVALGAAMGGLALTRENAMVLVPVILLWAMFRVEEPLLPRRERTAPPRRLEVGAFALGLAIVLAPVAARNYVVGGGLYLTTSQVGPNFYIGNNPKADGTYMSLRFGRGAPEYERQDATDLAQLALGRTLSPAEVSGYWTDRALGFITSQPGAWLALLARKFRLLWNADEMLDTESQETYAEWSAPLRFGGWLGHFGVLVPLAVLGAWLWWPDWRRLWVFHVMALSYAASVLVFYVFARYRFPLVPFLILFASSGLATLAADAGSPARRPPLVAPAAIVAAVAVFTNWPMLPASLMKAITENNLASSFQESGQLDQAAVHYQRSIAFRTDYAPAHNNLGVALRSQGRLDDAIASYQRALEVHPDYPDAHYNLGNALLDKKRPSEAAAHFRIALGAIPDSAGSHNNLGIALAAEGKLEESIAEFRAALEADPESGRTHRNLGNALSALGRTREGLTYLQRAVKLDPSAKEARYDLGTQLLELNQPAEAVTQFEAALALDTAWAAAHNNLGIALASQGRLEDAIRHFQAALEIQPGFADAQRNLALALDSRRVRR